MGFTKYLAFSFSSGSHKLTGHAC